MLKLGVLRCCNGDAVVEKLVVIIVAIEIRLNMAINSVAVSIAVIKSRSWVGLWPLGMFFRGVTVKVTAAAIAVNVIVNAAAVVVAVVVAATKMIA